RVENGGRFGYAWPMRWEKLLPTGDDGVRFCGSCRKEVYHCGTVEEARGHAFRGHCVAVDSRLARAAGDLPAPGVFADARMTVGVIAPPGWRSSQEPPPPNQARTQRPARKGWWQFWKRAR